jgi:hypothetical protein
MGGIRYCWAWATTAGRKIKRIIDITSGLHRRLRGVLIFCGGIQNQDAYLFGRAKVPSILSMICYPSQPSHDKRHEVGTISAYGCGDLAVNNTIVSYCSWLFLFLGC